MLALLGAVVALVATRVWPAHDPLERTHSHPELPADHPHLRSHPGQGNGHAHAHAYHIDDLHPNWAETPN